MPTYRVDAYVDGDKLSVAVQGTPSTTEVLTAALPLLKEAARELLGLNHGPVKIASVTLIEGTA